MKITIVNDSDGCPKIEVVNPASGEVLSSTELGLDQQVEISLPNAHQPSDVVVGEVKGNAEVEQPPEPGDETPGQTGEPGGDPE